MPRSRRRKGAKPYRQKRIGDTYSVPEPLALFRTIGKRTLEHDEEEAACLLLLNTMGAAEPQAVAYFKTLGIDWPPVTTDDIRTIGTLLVEREREDEIADGASH